VAGNFLMYPCSGPINARFLYACIKGIAGPSRNRKPKSDKFYMTGLLYNKNIHAILLALNYYRNDDYIIENKTKQKQL